MRAHKRTVIHLPSELEHIKDVPVEPVGTIVSVLSKNELPDGRIYVQCLAGPRVIVKSKRVEEMKDGTAGLVHVAFEPYVDDPVPDDPDVNELVQHLHERCVSLIENQGLHAKKGELPPLFDPERLSLWLGAVCAHPSDQQTRMSWLYIRDTALRLRFVLDALNEDQGSKWSNFPQ